MGTVRSVTCLAVLSCLGLWGCTDDRTVEREATTIAKPEAEKGAEAQKEEEEKDKTAEKGALAAAATVSIEQAVKTGIAKQPGKVIEAELEREDGRVVWDLEIVAADGSIAELSIDASSGAIVED